MFIFLSHNVKVAAPDDNHNTLQKKPTTPETEFHQESSLLCRTESLPIAGYTLA